VGITFVLADQAKDVEKIARTLSLHPEFGRSGLERASRSEQPRTRRASGSRRPRPRGRSGRRG
jgi:hypothetical protein